MISLKIFSIAATVAHGHLVLSWVLVSFFHVTMLVKVWAVWGLTNERPHLLNGDGISSLKFPKSDEPASLPQAVQHLPPFCPLNVLSSSNKGARGD